MPNNNLGDTLEEAGEALSKESSNRPFAKYPEIHMGMEEKRR